MSNMNNPEEEGREHATKRSKNYWFVSPGSKVEVRSDEDGYQNAWFAATVLDQVTPSKSRTKRRSEAVVLYDHMLDEETQEPLVEKVDVRLIRPTPPPQDFRTVLEPNDVVDAFYDEVWWTGYVVRRVNDRYTVAFKNPPDVLEVGRSDLRVHWDWVDNSFWDKPPKEANTRSFFSPTMEVEVDPYGDKPVTTWYPGVYLGETSSGFHMVKYKSSDGDDEEGSLKIQVDYDQIRPRPPKIEEKDFELLEKVDAFHGLAWTVGVVTKVLVEKKYTVTFQNLKKEVDFDCSKIRPHMDWIDGQWVSKSKGMEFKSKHQEFMRKCDAAKSIEIITLDESSSSATIGDNEEVTFFKQREQKEPSPVFGSSIKEKVNRISNDKSAEVVLTGNDEITTPNEVEEMTNRATKSAEKRETPQNFKLGQISWPNKQAEKEISEVLVDNVVETADMETSNPVTEDGGLESVYPEQAQSSGIVPEPKDFMDTDIVDKVSQPPIESDIGMSCVLNQVHEVPESPIVNLQTQTEKDNEIGEAVFASTEKLESAAHACSKLIGDVTSEAIVGTEDCSDGMLEAPGSTCLKLADSQAHDSANCPTNVNGSDFPFARSSPIWKFLESMEVFARFPQSPHFRPLLKYCEREREGLAVGHMVNYANMMVRISKLRENVPKEDIDHIVRGFSTYEELGFDLKSVKDRLSELLKTKAQIEKLEDESKRLASSMKEFVDQEAIIEREVSEIDREIEKLTRKRAMMMSDCTEHRSKLSRLSLEAEAISADLLSRREYSSSLMIVI